jgi:hypothetical protein
MLSMVGFWLWSSAAFSYADSPIEHPMATDGERLCLAKGRLAAQVAGIRDGGVARKVALSIVDRAPLNALTASYARNSVMIVYDNGNWTPERLYLAAYGACEEFKRR